MNKKTIKYHKEHQQSLNIEYFKESFVHKKIAKLKRGDEILDISILNYFHI